MFIQALVAAAVLSAPPAPQEQSSQSPPEHFGTWQVRTRVDAITDEISVGAYLGTPADYIAIACAKDAPGSTVVLWRSTTRFRQTGYVPRTGREASLAGMLVGSTAYRFDQDAPVVAQTSVSQDYSSEFGVADVQALISKLATSSRLVLRDRLHEAHTVVFELVPSDTLRALQRLDAICGTAYAATLPSQK